MGWWLFWALGPWAWHAVMLGPGRRCATAEKDRRSRRETEGTWKKLFVAVLVAGPPG